MDHKKVGKWLSGYLASVYAQLLNLSTPFLKPKFRMNLRKEAYFH
ncbi:hypothetical protein QUB07_02605 [Microcoleus sp. F8-C5]